MTFRLLIKFLSFWATLNSIQCLFSPLEGCKVIVMNMSVCLSVRWRNSKNHMAKLHQFLCMLLMAVAQFSSGGVAIRYVLPVLWMAPCFHTMILWRVICNPRSGDRTR